MSDTRRLVERIVIGRALPRVRNFNPGQFLRPLLLRQGLEWVGIMRIMPWTEDKLHTLSSRRKALTRLLMFTLLLPAIASWAKLAGAQEVQNITPAQLPSLLKSGRKVKLVLRTGAFAEGKFEEVDTTRLKLNVTKSEDLARGPQDIPLENLGSLTVTEYKGNKRKWLPVIFCSTVGALGLAVGIGSASEESKGTYAALGAAVAGGVGVGGYYAGRAMDRKQVTFVIK